jgi:hypothetical protein
MTKTKAQKNIEFLKPLRGFAPEAKKSQINTIINLYKQKQITNIRSAVNAINLLSSTKKNQKEKAKKTFIDLIDNATGAHEATKALTEHKKVLKKHHLLPDDYIKTGDHSKVNSYMVFNIKTITKVKMVKILVL